MVSLRGLLHGLQGEFKCYMVIVTCSGQSHEKLQISLEAGAKAEAEAPLDDQQAEATSKSGNFAPKARAPKVLVVAALMSGAAQPCDIN